MRLLPTHYVLCGGLLALLPSALLTDPYCGAGAHLSSVAAELRWERAVGFVSITVAWLRATGSLAAFCASFVLNILALGVDAAGDEFSQSEASVPALWGAPAHLVCAFLCCGFSVATVAAVNTKVRPLHWAGPALLSLGLLWNFMQGGGRKSWVWDWIEAGPLVLTLACVCSTHLWAKGSTFPLLSLAYLAFLQVSRAALLTSAHHLQPPLAIRPSTEVAAVGVLGGASYYHNMGVCLALAGCVYLYCQKGLTTANLRPLRSGLGIYLARGNQRMHVYAGAGLSLTLAPLWVSGSYGPTLGMCWLWLGWLGLYASNRQRGGSSAWF